MMTGLEVVSLNSSYSVLVAVMAWNGKHHAFVNFSRLKTSYGRFSDLSTCFYFFWGYLNAQVFKRRPLFCPNVIISFRDT